MHNPALLAILAALRGLQDGTVSTAEASEINDAARLALQTK